MPPSPRHARLVDVGRDTAELLSLWLAEAGMQVDEEHAPHLVFAERAYLRYGERDWLQAIAWRWPGVPVVLLSPTLFPTVPARGDVAREFGVAAVLASPLGREQLLHTVQELLAGP
jgi:hypothetical protein